jgi:hypothetical protein
MSSPSCSYWATTLTRAMIHRSHGAASMPASHLLDFWFLNIQICAGALPSFVTRSLIVSLIVRYKLLVLPDYLTNQKPWRSSIVVWNLRPWLQFECLAWPGMHPRASEWGQGGCDHWQRCPEEYMNHVLFPRWTLIQESNPGANLQSNEQTGTASETVSMIFSYV